MVTIRTNQKHNFCVPSICRIPKWWYVVGVSLVFALLNLAWHRMPDVQVDGTTITIKRKEIFSKLGEEIYPKPDGTKDYNLVEGRNPSSFNAFSFYGMGDTPYRDWQETRLRVQISEMKEYVKKNPDRNLSFTVHVGDTQKVSTTNCAESAYINTASVLEKGPLPTLVVPGDNDWYDCPNRTESFGYFQEHFGTLETRWHKKDYKALGIERSVDNPELFVFYKEGILFIGLHLINAPIEHEDIRSWDARMKVNKEWVARHIESYFQKLEIRGVILLGHCLRSPRTRPFFLTVADYFVNITHRENVPVLYLHGDGHKWDVDTKLSHQIHWKHFRDVQVDQGGLADPIIVDIASQKEGKLKGLTQRNDLEVVFGKGLFRIDRQRGKYKDPKKIDELKKKKTKA